MTHLVALNNLCRVCGRSVVTKSVMVKYQCADYREKPKMAFGIDTTLDSSDIPQYFCRVCKNVLQRASNAGYQHRIDIFLAWDEHTEGSCSVCERYDMIRKGGGPNEICRTPGRPLNNGPVTVLRTSEILLLHPLCWHTTHTQGSVRSIRWSI